MIKFLIQPKEFKKPNGTSLNIEAISVVVNEFPISNDERVSMRFMFYKKEDGEYVHLPEYDHATSVFKQVTLPVVGDVDFVAGLVSYNKQNVYNVAQLFAGKYEYVLLPIEEQIFLNN